MLRKVFALSQALPVAFGGVSVVALLLLASAPVAGQTPASPAIAKTSGSASAKAWTPGRTADGQPDLQGVWTTSTLTPFERPADLANKPVLTAQEAAAYQKQLLESLNRDKRPASAEADAAGAYNEAWFDRGTTVVGTRRTSLVVDPPDGKIPAYTPEALKRVDAARLRAVQHPADGPEDRSLSERCLLWGTSGPPMIPGPYNNNYQIVQSPGYVTIYSEMIHDARVIPTDGRSHLPSTVRQWAGDSRGRWEGNTLVVDTINFNGKAAYRGTGDQLHLTERFTRTDAGTIRYEFTVDDPATFTKPWTVQVPMTRSEGPIFEYACHEGNYALVDMLAGARLEEKKAAAGAARK